MAVIAFDFADPETCHAGFVTRYGLWKAAQKAYRGGRSAHRQSGVSAIRCRRYLTPDERLGGLCD